MSIQLRDEDGALHPMGFTHMIARQLYPDCDASAEQVAMLAAYERARLLENPNARPSALSNTVMTALGKATGKRHVTGLIGLVLALAEDRGHKATLYVAVRVVSACILAGTPHGSARAPFWRFGRDGITEGELKLQTNIVQLENIFRDDYRSVAHICAAEVLAARHAEPRNPFEAAPEYELCFINTAAWVQTKLAPIFDKHSWPIWDVLSDLPRKGQHNAFFELPPSLLDALFGPYEAKRDHRAQ